MIKLKLNLLKCKADINDNIKDLNYLANQMEDINDLQKIRTFASNLNIDTKGYLGLQNPQTLTEAQQLPIAYETHIKIKF